VGDWRGASACHPLGRFETSQARDFDTCTKFNPGAYDRPGASAKQEEVVAVLAVKTLPNNTLQPTW